MKHTSRTHVPPKLARGARVALVVSSLAACGDRPDTYDTPIGKPDVFGLSDRVVIVDDGAHRAVVLTARSGQEVDRASLAVGRGVTRTAASPDRKRVFVLAAGDQPRKKAEDERPSLTVIEAPQVPGGESVVRRLPLESPHTGLAIDPSGRYVAIFAAPSTTGVAASVFVENPNEIIVIDLTLPDERAIVSRTLRSFGGRPQRLTFTPTLGLPGGPRRLLVTETDQDIVLLDLDHIADGSRPEVTVRLTSGASTKALIPAGIVVDDGDPDKSDDARIGVRLGNDSNVVTLTLGPRPPAAPGAAPSGGTLNDFSPTVNLTDVGGPPGDIAFVRTDAGVRLAAIVPSTQSAVLVDPQTSVTTKVDLPGRFGRISLITTNVTAGPKPAGQSDTALLYAGDGGSSGVAFWALGKTGGQPYRSVEVVSLSSPVTRLLEVPAPRAELKILQGTASEFFVLNLATRTASPLLAQRQPTIHVAEDGQRLWAFQRGGTQLTQVLLENLHPVQLPLDRTLDSVFEIARSDGRSLLAIDVRGGVGVTALDALTPDTASARSYYGLLLEGLQ